MKTKLDNFRNEVKDEIVKLLTKIYLKHNDNQFPKWFDDEEIVVEDNEIGHTNTISVVVDYGGSDYLEKWTIEEYRVNCSGELFFWCNETLDEVIWTSVSTDELCHICTQLNTFFSKLI